MTMRLKRNHPEVYLNLDENPITLKVTKGTEASEAELREYLQTLKHLLKNHSK